MKFTTSLLAVFLALAVLPVQAQQEQVQSDYEIQQQFIQQYNRLQIKMDTVSTVDSARAIIQAVKELNQQYQDNAELLNNALYPNTFEETITRLRESAAMTLNRVQERQMRTEKLASLQEQLSKYEQNLEQLTGRTDSLREAIQASIANEKRQAELLETYREGLEQRDELILAFIDSMIVAYRQMDLQSLQGLENLEQRSELESNGNALKLIHEITVENLQILQNNSGQLRLQDYLRMSEVQQEFQQMWQILGDEIREIYSGEDTGQLAAQIEQNINEWDQLLKNQTFATLSDSLKAQGVEIQEFTNAQGLYTALNSYLTEQINQSREGASEANYNEYQQFLDFWNKIELRWANNFVDAGILTADQLSEINAKVDEWAEYARPGSNILIWLLGAAVIIAIILAVLFVRERQSPNVRGER